VLLNARPLSVDTLIIAKNVGDNPARHAFMLALGLLCRVSAVGTLRSAGLEGNVCT
jgi:hypothetical protein